MTSACAQVFSIEFTEGTIDWQRFREIVLAVLILPSLGSMRFAEQAATTGDLTGVVMDPSGDVLPDARFSLPMARRGNYSSSAALP
jgi:hypothetical protein